MTNIFTIIDENADSATTISHDNRAEALRMVAQHLIDACDHSRERGSARAAIEEGVTYAPGYKGPRAVYLATDPEEFWFALATHMTTDNVDFIEGEPEGEQ